MLNDLEGYWHFVNQKHILSAESRLPRYMSLCNAVPTMCFSSLIGPDPTSRISKLESRKVVSAIKVMERIRYFNTLSEEVLSKLTESIPANTMPTFKSKLGVCMLVLGGEGVLSIFVCFCMILEDCCVYDWYVMLRCGCARIVSWPVCKAGRRGIPQDD